MSAIHPSHYQSGNFDVIHFCLHHDLDFCTGNAIKYLTRAGRKEPEKYIEDLDKAIEYINRLKQNYNENLQRLHNGRNEQ